MTAPGVTQLDQSTDDTTVVTDVWWWAYALAPVAAVLGWWSAGGDLRYRVVGAALVVPHVVVAAIVVVRHDASGWSDGLAVLGFLHPSGLLAVTVFAFAVPRSIDQFRGSGRCSVEGRPA